MATFKMLHGDESNISLDITPFHEGWAYITTSGYYYVDLNIGTAESPNNQRIKLNAGNAETLTGMTLEEIQKSINYDNLINKPTLGTLASKNEVSKTDLVSALKEEIENKANASDVPTKVSDLTNDSGFITGYTETDPTVPAWAKSATKPTYTASEVGALPNTTKIPTKVSDLTNDSGFITDVPNEIYIGEGDMPEESVLQIVVEDDEYSNLPDGVVLYNQVQYLTDSQKAQARENIGVMNEIYVTTPQMYGAQGDGTTDDTAAIQATLDASSIVYIPDGTYMINANVGISPMSNQTILLSKNAVLKAITGSTGTYNVINIVNKENIHIKGGKVYGYRDNLTTDANGEEFGRGINIVAGKNITIEQVELFDCWSDSISIGWNHATGAHSYNVRIVNCHIHNYVKNGVLLAGCENVSIRDCEIGGVDCNTGCIYINPDRVDETKYGVVKNITIDNCNLLSNNGSIGIDDPNSTNEIKGLNITNSVISVIWCTAGNDIYFNNCNVGFAGVGSLSPMRFTNSKIEHIYLMGDGVFDNCDIVSETMNLIASGLDAYPSRKSSLYCSNCRFVLNNISGENRYLIIANKGNDTNGNPAKIIVFDKCSITLGEKCSFTNGYSFDEFRMEHCKVVLDKEPYCIMSPRANLSTSIVLKDTDFTCQGTPNYTFELGHTSSLNLDIVGCTFPETKKFMYDYGDDSGRIRIFDSVISSNNGIVGTPSENLELFISNSIDTAVMADSSNLITSGAVNTALKGLSLGIAEDGLVYLYVNGQAVGTGISVGSGTSGDVYGYVDSNNIVTLQGNLTSGNYTIKYEVLNADGNIIRTYEIGDMELDTTIKNYSVTNNLTNCTNSNTVTSVQEGSSYNATITANSGYVLSSVNVTMGDSPVTVTDGVINIANVTGNIVITTTVVALKNYAQPLTVGRLSNSATGNVTSSDAPTSRTTEFVPVQNGDTVYVEGFGRDSSVGLRFMAFDSDKVRIGTLTDTLNFSSAYASLVKDDNQIAEFNIISNDVAYVRFSQTPSGSEDEVTVNIKRGGEWIIAYTVTKNLTNCTISNSATEVIEGQSYSATVTANSGYELDSVSVTMGGSAVTVTNGVINIASVTGDIVITAVATETVVTPSYINKFVIGGDGYILNGRCSSAGADRTDAGGYVVSNYIAVSNGDTVYVNKPIGTANSGVKLSDGSVAAAAIPSDSTYIENYSVSNGISQFTIKNANVEFVRIQIQLATNGLAITNTDVENAGIIITVNEPIV